MKSVLQSSSRIIVKVGSSLVTNEGRGLDHEAIARWAAQISSLRSLGKEVVLVSSGAIAEGMLRLGFTSRPTDIHELQACAACGQMGLAQIYETSFRSHGVKTAQVLLTHADLADRERYLNARSTLTTLLGLGVVPIINENDTVVTDEIKFGDNDTLGALVANLIEADALVILTDQKGLYSADPRKDPSARLIEEAQAATHASSSPLRSAIAMRPARRTVAYSESAVFFTKPLRVDIIRNSAVVVSRSATSAETRSPCCIASRMFWIGVPFAVRLASGSS